MERERRHLYDAWQQMYANVMFGSKITLFRLSLMLLVRTRSSSNLCFDFSINLSKPVKQCHISVYFRIQIWHNHVGCFASMVLLFVFCFCTLTLGIWASSWAEPCQVQVLNQLTPGSQCCCRKPTCWRTFRLWCASPFQIPVSWNCAIGGKR